MTKPVASTSNYNIKRKSEYKCLQIPALSDVMKMIKMILGWKEKLYYLWDH